MEDVINSENENVLLVIVDFKDPNEWDRKQIHYEMKELVKACGGQVMDAVPCRCDAPSAKTLITKGKVEEISALCQSGQYDTVVFSCDLKGNQQRNLEEEFKIKTIDRTQLILDIFARHASSIEGKMQVELAQLEYLLPRLVGKGIELSRLGGGIGTLGPGETKLEVDRRRIGKRISKLKNDLKDVTSVRQTKRKQRQKNKIPTISLVGYTNAGKSTLLNALTEAGTKTKDGLFTTLDSLSRSRMLPNHQNVVFSDTVGFMHSLPHHLIEAFKATLEEVQDADLLLHVVDVSAHNYHDLYSSVNEVLKEIKCLDKPTLVVLNKVDKLDDLNWIERAQKDYDYAVCISAKTQFNFDQLFEAIISLLSHQMMEIDVELPLGRMDLINLAHQQGEVISVDFSDKGIQLHARLPRHVAGKILNH